MRAGHGDAPSHGEFSWLPKQKERARARTPTFEEQLFRDLWEDETQRDVVIESLQADCEIRTGRPAGPFEI